MRSPDLRQVRHDVVGDVLIGERAAIGLILAGIPRAPGAVVAAEHEPRHVVGLDGAGEQERQRRHARVGTEQLLLLELEVQRIRGASPADLEGRTGIQDARRGEHVVRAGVHEERRGRELIAAVAGPRRPVRLRDVFPVLHVPAGHSPFVGWLEVHAQQIFTARRAVRDLAREVQAAAPREIRVGENTQRSEAGSVEPARGNPAEDAAVLETATRVGRAAWQAGGEITDIRERSAAAVDAL